MSKKCIESTKPRKNSKRKGKRFELEIANALKAYGYETKRTAQVKGNTGEAADVEGLPNIHIECKHAEQFKIYDWMKQAISDNQGHTDLPAVFYRKNRQPTLVTMTMDDFMVLYQAASPKLTKACKTPRPQKLTEACKTPR